MKSDPDQIARMASFHDLTARGVFRNLFEGSRGQIYVFDDATLKLIGVNRAARDLHSTSLQELKKRSITDLLPHLAPSRVERVLDAVRHRYNHTVRAKLNVDPDSDTAHNVHLSWIDGDDASIVITVRDISERIRIQRRATEAQQMMMTAINALSDGFVLYDADDRLVICNDRYRKFYDRSAEAMYPGNTFEAILRYGLKHNQYADAIGREEEWLRWRLAEHVASDTDLEQRLSDGRWIKIVERRTETGGRVGLRVDITKLKTQQETLSRIVRTDELTNLRNRRNLTDDLQQMVKELSRRQKIAILHVDLDGFKAINDVIGHAAGDAVLRNAARILTQHHAPDDLVARVGGDEFILAFRCSGRRDVAVRRARDVIEALSAPFCHNSQNCQIGASVGIAFLSEPGADTAAEALSNADIALDASKQEGGNEVMLYTPDMRAKAMSDNAMAQQIRTGLTRSEFQPYFQPQLDLVTGKVIGYEALIRWRNPDRVVPAGQFLSVAQAAGLTSVLDDIVTDQSVAAISQLRDWGVPDPKVSINLSRIQISDPALLSRLRATLEKYDVPAHSLRLEMLESTLLDEGAGRIVRNVHHLIEAGFQIELDDFGTGHSAISTLRKFDVARIKIDRSFVRHIDGDKELRLMTSAIIDLAAKLGITVLAEGVETNGEAGILQELGCAQVQGYYYAKPMPLEDVPGFLAGQDLGNSATSGGATCLPKSA